MESSKDTAEKEWSGLNRACHGFRRRLDEEANRREKLQCLYENLMSNNFCRTAVLKKI